MKITHPGDRSSYRNDIVVILIAFLLSRVLSALFGIHLGYDALSQYWQYLDIATLQHDLLRGVWYDHAQPPFFNLILGLVLKLSGNSAPIVFAALLKCISLANCFLLLAILRRVIPAVAAGSGAVRLLARNAPLLITLVYLLSPALMIFESELFYTTFISMLLLISTYFILQLQENASAGSQGAPRGGHPWKYAIGIFLPLTILCLTRSMYHIVWLLAVGLCLLFVYKRTNAFKPLLTGAFFSLLLVSGWYLKNYMIFGQFSTSSWLGMNLARTVFHDHPTTDSAQISTIEPFSALRYYHAFADTTCHAAFAGLDDRDLLSPSKNNVDTIMNLNHVDYLGISKQYMKASTAYMKQHPGSYLKNALQSSIIFFAPATRYPYAEQAARKIKYYDLLYSFNLSHFASTKGPRRIALTLSAIPKFFIYLSVFYLLGMDIYRRKKISPLNLFILCTICYVFFTSSLVEHYENMRFRYEIEPLFLVLLGQALLLAKPFKTIFNTSSALNQGFKS
ncbi:MAG TPA: hypothetical protein VHD83_23480 [Puia sp.]|nr:hypothetical protein [Puia sp.]